MSDRLSVDDLVDVQRKLYAVKTEWYNLGLELGQRVSTLDSIDTKYCGDPSQCFRQVLKEWLKGINPPPTWQVMVNALKSPTVGQHQVAERIQSELPPALSMQLLSTHPLSMSPQLLSLPSPSTHPKSLGPSSDEGVAVAQRNYQMIHGRFARLLRIASRRLQSVVSIDEFQLFVINLFQPGDCIPDSASVHAIFRAITKNRLWDCVNHFPLIQIIEEFASEDIQLSESVKQYEEARSGYMLCTKISDYIGVFAVSDTSDIDSDEQLEEKPAKYDPRYYRRLSLKVKAEVTEMSMQYVCELWQSLASHYRLPSRTAILDSVHADCILVMWLVPTKHIPELIEKARADPDFFTEHNVLWAAVDDDDYLYNCKEEPMKMPAQNNQSVTSVTVTAHVQDIAGAELADLVDELREVTSWFLFGLYLGVKKCRLEAIYIDNATTEERRMQLLNHWASQGTPTWSAVIMALLGIGMRHLASMLAEKHGILVPQQLDDETLGQLHDISQEGAARPELLPKVQKYGESIHHCGKELVKTEKKFSDSQKARAIISDKTGQIQDTLSKIHENVQKTVYERDHISEKLQSKERECQLLSDVRGMLEKDLQREGEAYERINWDDKLLEEMINRKEKKIKESKKELQKKESELESAQKHIKVLQKELAQAHQELKKEQEVMEKLQLKVEKLAHSCNIGRHHLGHLVQRAFAPTSESESEDDFPDQGLVDFDDLPDVGDIPEDGSRATSHYADLPLPEGDIPESGSQADDHSSNKPPDVGEKGQDSTKDYPQADSQSQLEQLQIQVQQLTAKLQAKDAEIIEMQGEFRNLTADRDVGIASLQSQVKQLNVDPFPGSPSFSHWISPQATCTEVQNGPTRDYRWDAGLDLNIDQAICGGTIIAYQILWFKGKWSGWYVRGVNDIDTRYNRRWWACFIDHTHRYIICKNP